MKERYRATRLYFTSLRKIVGSPKALSRGHLGFGKPMIDQYKTLRFLLVNRDNSRNKKRQLLFDNKPITHYLCPLCSNSKITFRITVAPYSVVSGSVYLSVPHL